MLVGVNFDDASASASALKIAGVLALAWDADITVFHSATQEAPVYFTAAQIETLGTPSEAALFGRWTSTNVPRIAFRTRT